MIVRQYAACEECGTVHVLRIGLGTEPIQAHHFTCKNCAQEMGVRLEEGVGTIFGPNTVQTPPDDSGPIVNLHPSFVFAKVEVDSPTAFPSVDFGQSMLDAALDAREKAGLPASLDDIAGEHLPQPRTTDEWDHLRAAWSLTRNGKRKLAAKRIAGFDGLAGYADRPDTLAD